MFLDHSKLVGLDPKQVVRYHRPNTLLASLKRREPIEDNIPLVEKTDINFTRKIRIYPDKQQKLFFNKMLGANRHFFNRTNAYIKNNPQDPKRYDHFYMRRLLFADPEDWYDEIPYDSKSLAIKQCTSAYASAFENLRNGNIESFDIKYLSKKQTTQIFFVDTRAFNFKKKAIFATKLKNHRFLRTREPVPETTCSNLIIQKTKPGIWYLCVPYEGKSSYRKPQFKNVFIDPGSRTFLTCYNPQNNNHGKIGDGFIEDLMLLGFKIDKLTSLACKSRGRRRRNLERRLAKIREHMKNKVRDMHWKACSLLTKNFEHIFLPYFDSTRICDSIERNINNKAARKIMTLSHGMFRTRMQHAAKANQRSLFYVPEAYTTKTCPACGSENNIGSAKWHSCACGFEGDRDETAATNICISTLLLTS